MYKRMVAFLISTSVVAMLSGCRSMNPNGPMIIGSDMGMDNGELLEGNIPLAESGSVMLDHVNREMFEPVLFAYDSATVNPAESAKVENVANYLKSNKDKLLIEGHTDERGSREYNQSLGERRALAVREYLIGLGVNVQRIQTSSKGEEEPAVQGYNENAYRQNRRAVFGIYQ